MFTKHENIKNHYNNNNNNVNKFGIPLKLK